MKYTLLIFCLFPFFASAQTNLYVNPGLSDASSADGTLSNPYNDIPSTVDLVAAAGGGKVIVVDGVYNMLEDEVTITTAATAATAVIIKPQSVAGVKFVFHGRQGFRFDNSASHITLKGFELDGESDVIDHQTLITQVFWSSPTFSRNGGLAIVLDGQYITIKDNYIHDWYQKGIEIRDARYVLIEGNIIHNIAITSLSGGHGIMRQQKGQEFLTDDVSGVYRWDIRENMIFNVGQTVFSWIPKSGYCHMVIDEGKTILIDDPRNEDGVIEHMSARIKNNVLAFGVVDHLRLKSTPNLEVLNNSIYSTGKYADGITDKSGDNFISVPIPFTNFVCRNNLVQTGYTNISGVEIDQAIQETISNGGQPDINKNYSMTGKVKPIGQPGITQLMNGQLFIDPENGNFRVNPALGLPINTGVKPKVLDSLDQRAAYFNVPVSPWNFEVDYLKLTQTVLDNIPGVDDGINGNETVFEDHGFVKSNNQAIVYKAPPSAWRQATGAHFKQIFSFGSEYSAWYNSIVNNYVNRRGETFERIRWGDSEIRQNHKFPKDWLLVAQIKSSSHTVIKAENHDLIIDGEVLIDFENFTPQVGDQFDIIVAQNITTKNTGEVFDREIFEGYTPTNYTVNIVNLPNGKQAVRLEILSGTKANLGSSDDQLDLNTAITEAKVFPNPSHGKFTLQLNEVPNEINIYDNIGRKITDQVSINGLGKVYEFDTKSQSLGLYFIKTDKETIRVMIE